MKKLSIIMVLIIILIIFIYESIDIKTREEIQKTASFDNGTIIELKIAKTQKELGDGLSNIENLPKDEGMLFIFDEEHQPSFWMKDMKFPIDIIWIKDNTIVDITKNLQPQNNTPDKQLPLHQPSVNVDMVLEVNADFVINNNLLIGNKIEFKNIN